MRPQRRTPLFASRGWRNQPLPLLLVLAAATVLLLALGLVVTLAADEKRHHLVASAQTVLSEAQLQLARLRPCRFGTGVQLFVGSHTAADDHTFLAAAQLLGSCGPAISVYLELCAGMGDSSPLDSPLASVCELRLMSRRDGAPSPSEPPPMATLFTTVLSLAKVNTTITVRARVISMRGSSEGSRPRALRHDAHDTAAVASPWRSALPGGWGIGRLGFFRAALFSDSQSGAPTFRHLLSHCAALSPPVQALLHAGDTVQTGDGGAATERETFMYLDAPLDEFAQRRGGVLTPLLLARGNHDPVRRLLRSLGSSAAGPTYYTARSGPIRWVVLDSSAPRDGRQAAWLREVCSSPPAVGILATLAVVHVPPYLEYWEPGAWTAGGESHWGDGVREDLLPLLTGTAGGGFRGRGCDPSLVVSGHSHVYQRGVDPSSGVPLVIIGGAGGALETDSEASHVESTLAANVTVFAHHFGVVSVGWCPAVGSTSPQFSTEGQGGARNVLGCPTQFPSLTPFPALRWEVFDLQQNRIDDLTLPLRQPQT